MLLHLNFCKVNVTFVILEKQYVKILGEKTLCGPVRAMQVICRRKTLCACQNIWYPQVIMWSLQHDQMFAIMYLYISLHKCCKTQRSQFGGYLKLEKTQYQKIIQVLSGYFCAQVQDVERLIRSYYWHTISFYTWSLNAFSCT